MTLRPLHQRRQRRRSQLSASAVQPNWANPVFPSFGNGGYDVSHYDLDLIIDPGANTLTGVATIRVKVTANLAAFNFDFVGPKVSEVRVNGEPAIFTRTEN